MKQEKFTFSYEVYQDGSELSEKDAWLLNEARQVTDQAYAPYSRFQVGAAAVLANGEVVTGSNQENASFPVGLCAERVLLSAATSLYPGVPIDTIAVSYFNNNGESSKPISPCGICRQSLQEYETRMLQPIRLILSGMEGKVYVISEASHLLPLGFSDTDLKGDFTP